MAKSLFDALHEKYGDDDDDQGGFVHIVVGKRPRHKSGMKMSMSLSS